MVTAIGLLWAGTLALTRPGEPKPVGFLMECKATCSPFLSLRKAASALSFLLCSPDMTAVTAPECLALGLLFQPGH